MTNKSKSLFSLALPRAREPNKMICFGDISRVIFSTIYAIISGVTTRVSSLGSEMITSSFAIIRLNFSYLSQPPHMPLGSGHVDVQERADRLCRYRTAKDARANT